MARLFLAAPVGLLFAVLLFVALTAISGMKHISPPDAEALPVLDFLMLRQENPTELRTRELPPEPEELPAPPQPKLPELTQPLTALASPLPSVQVPDIKVGVVLSLAPTLNNLQAPAPEIYLDSNPVALTRIAPHYPRRAIRKKLEGRVLVEFWVTKTGAVKPDSIVVLESQPQGVFDAAVRKAIQGWRFQKRMVDGQAVAFKGRQELEFKLEQ